MELKGIKALIVGAGKSGVSAVGLLMKKGADIVLYDASETLSEEEVLAKLPKDYTGRVVLGEMTGELKNWAELLILSPGVPTDLNYVNDMRDRGVTIWGEIELAYQFGKGRMVAITGTNGKTTTTALTGEIMRTFYDSVYVVGNIGNPYADAVLATTEESVTVAEMSSFQLETIDSYRPDVSAILNITPDHLNRHHTMENYIAAKANVLKNQTEKDVCILNYEDAELRKLGKNIRPRVIWFSSARKLTDGMYLDGDVITYAHDGEEIALVNIAELNIIGRHNYENAMAAAAAGLALGVPAECVRKALRSFVAVEHRIEYVATIDNVKYYNDSKGTNPDASIQAVKAMTAKTLLIGGGYDKGSEYDEWIESFEGKIKYLVLMGQTREKIAETARRHGFENIVMVESMEEAVAFCHDHAEPGECVLLSPCCASWGMFKNYEERGRIFKDLVRRYQ
ncbi:MAG: UDP-N-acetylmuramoyl-L-alanine--D-glutamate ligase [Lachnospiraceae bacterium]|nr:UDP-N-acetylmuramoyl-L-alanine--D-glutamate ligase [Lachnospiraceae bacterium]